MGNEAVTEMCRTVHDLDSTLNSLCGRSLLQIKNVSSV